MNLSESRTAQNLMRAFAGECQARTRYEFAAKAAMHEKLPCIQQVFSYTAGQEYEHAGIFFKLLRGAGVNNVEITGGYPVDLNTNTLVLLRNAQHNEGEEHLSIYPDFARIASEEGFADIARIFQGIAAIEQTHGQRFGMLADQLEGGVLFSSGGAKVRWVCLNCGNVVEASEAPAQCPICSHEQGYYLRENFAPYTSA